MSTKLAVPCLMLLAAMIGPAAAAETAVDAPRGGIRLVGNPDTIERPVVTLNAQGAQVYECKATADGKLAWSFREPIATLIENGKTVGRHYAGPNWELQDGSAVTAKVLGSTGGTESDIPWLKLEVTAHRGNGTLSEVTTVQRINTHGGKLDGACDKAGEFKSAPYSAEYVFLKKG
ncbi:DUF3455 domain-containing protein [Bradyrhizobium manausense]|uniref:DUF3455 domain-containing protein n=1 Tax=Bradyrhizobium manausense TaxID=989370 RepID=UPI001BAD8EC4|nr:DUF3455 domain-containing protein [Bradyrhizobium manausense]MBR0722049.1 DUF3455 domain-containing protein [Bradyrhizobium manausense]